MSRYQDVIINGQTITITLPEFKNFPLDGNNMAWDGKSYKDLPVKETKDKNKFMKLLKEIYGRKYINAEFKKFHSTRRRIF